MVTDSSKSEAMKAAGAGKSTSRGVSLANTGVDALITVVLGFGVVAMLIGAFMLIARRRNV